MFHPLLLIALPTKHVYPSFLHPRCGSSHFISRCRCVHIRPALNLTRHVVPFTFCSNFYSSFVAFGANSTSSVQFPSYFSCRMTGQCLGLGDWRQYFPTDLNFLRAGSDARLILGRHSEYTLVSTVFCSLPLSTRPDAAVRGSVSLSATCLPMILEAPTTSGDRRRYLSSDVAGTTSWSPYMTHDL
ncbi:hypothetical protein BDZ97DRAFT_812464 [Flammula alnicola]|nr:hypothetical protein BDZ97DRAFT_812464 [Flammula alnicola]